MKLLRLPSTWKVPAATSAGIEIEIACEWVEASILFSGQSATTRGVVDFFHESGWFSAKGDADQFVNDVWAELRARRFQVGAGSPFEFSYQQMGLARKSWRETAGYAFCTIISYLSVHEEWAKSIRLDYNEQGDVFESVVVKALSAIMTGWTVYPTGWSRTRTNKLSQVVEDLAQRLNGTVGNLPRWNSQQAKEAGLDVVCYRQFRDGRGNYPAFFVQCASGRQLKGKLDEPNLNVWRDLLSLVPPKLARKAFATPFTFAQRDFERHAIRNGGLLLTKTRLFSADRLETEWLDQTTRRRLTRYTRPIAARLPWSA